MTMPLMPKATAVWLLENTTLTFDQIADFCTMHPLEVQGIADGDVATGLIGIDPTATGQLAKEELEKALENPDYRMKMQVKMDFYITEQKKQKGRYTPVARRQDKPDAISWLIKHHPELSDAQIVKLVGTTKKTIQSIKERTHWNNANLQPRDPVLLGVCTQTDLQASINKALAAQERAKKQADKEAARKKAEKAEKREQREKEAAEAAAATQEVLQKPEEQQQQGTGN